jgi:hypothetical protein
VAREVTLTAALRPDPVRSDKTALRGLKVPDQVFGEEISLRNAVFWDVTQCGSC